VVLGAHARMIVKDLSIPLKAPTGGAGCPMVAVIRM
jgi:hypothetical protein